MHILYCMTVSRRLRSFTLVEMVVVISIVLILLALVLPAITTMWNQTHVQNAHQRVSNLLKTARTRSKSFHNIMYGVLFYVDPITNHEVAVFIDGLMYPIELDETWPDVYDRFTVDTKNQYSFPMADVVRISSLDSLEWEDADLLNNDYRSGKQRNFFAIIFQRGGRGRPRDYILYDEDKDDDGLGDALGLPVVDTIGDHGGALRDIVSDSNDERKIIPTDWGFSIYDENVFKELSPDSLDVVSHLSYSLTRNGKTVALER